MELKQHRIMIALVAFILIQPLIDVLTTVSILYTNLPLTVGVVIRLAYLAVMAVWILLMARKSKKAKLYLAYLIGFAALVVANFTINYLVKEPFLLIEELTFYTKAVYFHVLFFGFLLLIEALKANGSDSKEMLIRYFLIVSGFISAVFVIAQVTGTSLTNYARSKEGWTGWFYAGNEIGATMAILLPITALYAVYRSTTFKKAALHWLPFVFLSISMLALGTKVGYAGIAIVLCTVFIGSLILGFMKKKQDDPQLVKVNAIVSPVLLALLIVVTPFSPVFGNMFAHFDILGISFDKKPVELDQFGDEILPDDDDEPMFTGEQLENLVFSSREQYKLDFHNQFEAAPVSQKLLGMGYAGNYETPERHKQLKMIEMDFHDWFYAFGIIGFLYMISPLLYFSGKYVWQFIRDLPNRFTYFGMLTGIAFLVGIGIAYTAGHVLTAPAVSIYLAFLLAVLVVTSNEETNQKTSL